MIPILKFNSLQTHDEGRNRDAELIDKKKRSG
jgi:hypothetical protein